MKKVVCALTLGLLIVSCAPRRTHVVVREDARGNKVTRVVHKHGPRCGHVFRNGGWVVVTKREKR